MFSLWSFMLCLVRRQSRIPRVRPESTFGNRNRKPDFGNLYSSLYYRNRNFQNAFQFRLNRNRNFQIEFRFRSYRKMKSTGIPAGKWNLPEFRRKKNKPEFQPEKEFNSNLGKNWIIWNEQLWQWHPFSRPTLHSKYCVAVNCLAGCQVEVA